jgi:hypothetical protein
VGSSSPLSANSTPTIVPSGSPTALVTIKGLTTKRLLLQISVAGTAIVRIARRQGNSDHRTWRTVKTIVIEVRKAGRVETKIPRLVSGRYRVRIILAGAKSVTTTLTVPRR